MGAIELCGLERGPYVSRHDVLRKHSGSDYGTLASLPDEPKADEGAQGWGGVHSKDVQE